MYVVLRGLGAFGFVIYRRVCQRTYLIVLSDLSSLPEF